MAIGSKIGRTGVIDEARIVAPDIRIHHALFVELQDERVLRSFASVLLGVPTQRLQMRNQFAGVLDDQRVTRDRGLGVDAQSVPGRRLAQQSHRE